MQKNCPFSVTHTHTHLYIKRTASTRLINLSSLFHTIINHKSMMVEFPLLMPTKKARSALAHLFFFFKT